MKNKKERKKERKREKEMSKRSVVNAVTFVIFDVVPAAVGIGVIFMLTLHVPELFVGLMLGYLYCKYQAQCKDATDKTMSKIESFRQKLNDYFSKESKDVIEAMPAETENEEQTF